MNKDIIKPLIESKSLEGFVTFNIKNNETEILNQTIEEAYFLFDKYEFDFLKFFDIQKFLPEV